MKRVEHGFKNLIIFLFIGLLSINLICCVFAEKVDPNMHIWCGRDNLFFLMGGILFLIVFIFLCRLFLDKHIYNHMLCTFQRYLIQFFLSFVLLLYLIISTHYYYFETGWDAGTVIWNAELLADGRISELENVYFSIYPNNVLLTVFFSWIIKLGRLFPLGTDYYTLIAFQCVCLSICPVLIHQIAISLSLTRKWSIISAISFLLLIGISPWVALPYSDMIGMFIIIIILLLFSKNVSPFFLGFLIVVGTMIKPTIFIFAIAMGIMGLAEFARNGKTLKKYIVNLFLFMLGAIISYFMIVSVENASGFELDSEKAMSPAHYIMMGLNEEYRGIINIVDQDYSLGISDYDDRVQANLEVAKERLAEMGPKRLLKHLLRKELYSFGDGTFAWGVEGQFFLTNIWTGNEKLESIFRSFYHPGRDNYRLYRGFEQMLWMGLIFFSIIGCLRNRNDKYYVLYLTVIGMVLFELIFEPRARHLLLIAPIICLVSANGLSVVIEHFGKKRISYYDC